MDTGDKHDSKILREEKRENGENYGESEDGRKERISERSLRHRRHVILRKELNFYIFC